LKRSSGTCGTFFEKKVWNCELGFCFEFFIQRPNHSVQVLLWQRIVRAGK
jgi:hypothetical protein